MSPLGSPHTRLETSWVPGLVTVTLTLKSSFFWTASASTVMVSPGLPTVKFRVTVGAVTVVWPESAVTPVAASVRVAWLSPNAEVGTE